ncbi:uncharacterized hydrophobic domain-containing protein [Geodermatophilus pulveris]|uniref:Uncharacterized hydrophobic domain-containing protein n=1 Tax=Geodermatophilus pulveris TaxID=1564159 RepID=A0A239I0V4_9ACTN|nr:DUF389 domain-containing protein [Geodermatophilus pulveris]SNS87091.1 uncharacterized hydrophobic domain-containing protein [Geodermatophilus pulveris]
MLLHLRITAPHDRTDAVVALLEDCPGTAHVAVLPGVSLSPVGDLVMADVARESADALVAGLRRLHVDRDGSITMEAVDAAVSDAAARAEDLAPGDGSDAVVWEQVVRTTAADSTLSVAYLAFLTIATLLAGVAIIVDSAVLVIGAMVLGPEFGPLAALAVGVVHRRPALVRTAAKALVVGFAVAIAITVLLALVGYGLGWYGPEVLSDDRPQTGFITAPDRWSPIVAVLAGVAGVLSLTAGRSGALVGVFISVTTVPAVADIGLSLALGGGNELIRAAVQLGVNLAGILVAATVTLAVQKYLWHRLPRTSPRVAEVGARATR